MPVDSLQMAAEMSVSVTRPARGWERASVTASRSAHLVQYLCNLDNTCFIGSIFGESVSDRGSQVPAYVDQFNNVGVVNASSWRFKHDIQTMDKVSETLYRLKPVNKPAPQLTADKE